MWSLPMVTPNDPRWTSIDGEVDRHYSCVLEQPNIQLVKGSLYWSYHSSYEHACNLSDHSSKYVRSGLLNLGSGTAMQGRGGKYPPESISKVGITLKWVISPNDLS
ncbi:hypothetical protein VNO77_37662 [Canavalia gladiata]|uniref:Uncharacterized protein n=1 Tax=Canavalia gladiata TaxID=3824 RepID=A0AAN9KBN9_CANGL